MKQYLDLLNDVLVNGNDRDDRTKVGTKSVFGRQIRFDMTKGFPAITTKKLSSTNDHRLAEIKNDNKPYKQLTEKERNTIWTLNSENQGKALGYENGELGRIYGYQWRHWNNQLCNVIEQIKRTPTSRRLLVSAWNVSD
jgi:thymidylate synthase